MTRSALPATSRPLIGITTRLGAEETFYLRRYYAEAVEGAGGAPVYIPLIPDRAYLSALCERLDGLALSGSNSDLDPVYYGEEPHQKLGPVLPERDETDLILLEVAERRAMPLLGICFGMQSLNVARGGSLIQDLASQIPEAVKHEQGQTINRPSHHIRIEAHSLLAELAGSETARVNSSHHQAINKVGRDLRVIARAPDGIIEAIIDTRPDRFTLGVQWHPEIGWDKDKFSQAIFKKFIEAAKL
ncbi:MAG TPA: gamma-glutamyl-gamma-aminobutyrate hydrolase family protein [Blastocatellia bacterium]|nr:gamma-glutamyl-gamma-aminobutyrate hydrolase family protein [Blastocatellia bacterium]